MVCSAFVCPVVESLGQTQRSLTIFSDGDRVARGGEKRFIEEVSGCQSQPHVILEDGNHFLQEDIPDAFLGGLLPWMEAANSNGGRQSV